MIGWNPLGGLGPSDGRLDMVAGEEPTDEPIGVKGLGIDECKLL